MSTPVLDVEPVVLASDEPFIQCEEWEPRCQAPADWILRCRRCSYPSFLCDRHLVVLRTRFSHWTCDRCEVASFDFDALVEVTRL